MNFADKVYALCKRIPKGKVSTYKEIGRALGGKGQVYRAVGRALKENKDPASIPCFRVVKSNGEIGGYGGSAPQNIQRKIKKLKAEGIEIKNNKIDLKKYLFKFV